MKIRAALEEWGNYMEALTVLQQTGSRRQTENTFLCCIGRDIPLVSWQRLVAPRGRSRNLGKGGSDKYIHNWGRVWEGACPSSDSKGDSSPSGVWGQYIHHEISGLLEPAWIATRKQFILHKAIVPTAITSYASIPAPSHTHHSINRAIKYFVNTHVGGFN